MTNTDTSPADSLDAVFVRGDSDALKAVYDAHGSTIYTLARRKLDEEKAKEATQDVFVSAWRARSTFDPAKGSLIGWLVGIAKNRIIDALRAEQRHQSRRSDSEVEDVAVAADVDRVGDRLLVGNALSRLAERPRRVIEMAYLRDMTHAEIAAETGIALGTIKSDIRRGLERIRADVEAAHV